MSAQLSTKLTLDGTQHNEALRSAAKELSKYKREVASTDKQLKLWKQQASSATGAVNTFAQSWKSGNIEGMLIGANGAAKSLGGTLTKFGGWFGVAVSAGEVFNRMMGESQQLSDAVAKVQNQAGEGVNYFASCLARADFSNFLDGLRDVIRLAGEAADAMDDVGSVAVRFGWVNQTLTSKYNAALANARNPENSKEERLKSAQEAKQLSDELTKAENTKAQADIAGAMKLIRTELSKQKYNGQHVDLSKISDEQLLKTFDIRNRGNVKSQHDAMVEADNGRILTNTKYGAHGAHLAKADYDKFAKNNNMLLSYAAEEINDASDSALATALQLVGGANMLKDQQAARQATIGRTLNKINKSEGGSGGGKRTVEPPLDENIGIIQQITNEMKALNKQKERATSIAEIKDLNNQLENLEWRLDMVKKGINPDALFNLKPEEIQIPVMPLFKAPDLNQKIQTPEIKVPTVFEQYDDIRNKMDNVMDAYDMGAIGAEKAQEFIDSLNAQLEALGLKPIQIHVESDAEQTLAKTGEIIGSLGDSFSSLGQSLQMPALDAAGIIAGAIASVIQGYGVASAQAASMGPFAWIAFALAGLGQVASIVAQIHSLSGYADGGIIGGNSYHGDRLLARVNSGEMILNGRQQQNLFNAIDGNRLGSNGLCGEVVFTIKGSKLQGVLHNREDKMNKIR